MTIMDKVKIVHKNVGRTDKGESEENIPACSHTEGEMASRQIPASRTMKRAPQFSKITHRYPR